MTVWSPEERATPAAALNDARRAQGFCDGYALISDLGEDPPRYICACGAMNGHYSSHEAAEALLDAHLDEQERLSVRFVQEWMAEHYPDVSVHITSYLDESSA
jgi:hypothetical protein